MGKSFSKKSTLISNFINVINSITLGTLDTNHYRELIEEIKEKNSFKECHPINFHLFFLDKLCYIVYHSELIFNDYKFNNEDISNKGVDLIKSNFSEEFAANDIKLKFFTGFLNFYSKQCQNVKCNYKFQEVFSSVFPFVELKFSSIEKEDGESLIQEKLNNIYYDKQTEGKCEKCDKVNKKYISHSKYLINYPKYLIIKINNQDKIKLHYSKNKQLIFFSKSYELFAVICELSTPGGNNNEELVSDYSCSIKIDYNWINFNDDIVTIVDEDFLFDNCNCLYYQLR